MITAWFRKAFRWFLEPAAAFMGKIGFTANSLTILGCLLNIEGRLRRRGDATIRVLHIAEVLAGTAGKE